MLRAAAALCFCRWPEAGKVKLASLILSIYFSQLSPRNEPRLERLEKIREMNALLRLPCLLLVFVFSGDELAIFTIVLQKSVIWHESLMLSI